MKVAMLNDMLMFGASVALLLAYQVFLQVKAKRNRYYTFKSVMDYSRAAWVRAIMDGGKDILAVQTFRNTIMAATFMATTAMLLITGVLTLSTEGSKVEMALHSLNHAGDTGPELWMTKMILLLIPLFVAFFAFTMSIRYTHHIAYMINVPVSGKYGHSSPDLVIAQMNRSAQFYWIGMRSYFYLVPLVFWLFGPHFMLAATGVLIGVMYHLDHMPMVEEKMAEADLPMQSEPVFKAAAGTKKGHLVSVS